MGLPGPWKCQACGSTDLCCTGPVGVPDLWEFQTDLWEARPVRVAGLWEGWACESARPMEVLDQ